MTENTRECCNCGAKLQYKPGTASLTCSYCGALNEIEVITENIEIKENDFLDQLSKLEQSDLDNNSVENISIKCETCGACVTLSDNKSAGDCLFCGSHTIAREMSTKQIKPESLLPFKIDRRSAAKHFRLWLKKRWFAPNKLKEFAKSDGLVGIYTPYWTYDTDTTSMYSGARGEYYYTTEHYTEEVDGKTVNKTRQVRHTRWHNTSGTVNRNFDDVLIYAGGNLDKKYIDRLDPWDLDNLEPYKDDYIAGFSMESYSLGLKDGFSEAKVKIDSSINSSVKSHIGGDEQRIYSINSSYDQIKFKHILLPLWLSTYLFKGKSYNFMVNARTGEVQGGRPYSAVKITLAVVGLLAAVAAGIFIYKYYN